jgi:hypothetical protein
VNPGESFTFTCETTGSTIIAWSSEELVGKGRFQISFLSIEDPGFIQYCQVPNNASFANLTMVGEDLNGNRVLESRLHIINVSATYDAATVVCHNRAQGLNKSITFSIGKMKDVLACITMIIVLSYPQKTLFQLILILLQPS